MSIDNYTYRGFTVMSVGQDFYVRLDVYYLKKNGRLSYYGDRFSSHNECNKSIDEFMNRMLEA